ncbi:MAG: acyl-CoA dehydrogenase [Alphaproteobacteria bacterium]
MASELVRLRRDLISRPFMKLYAKLAPRMSDTERQAIEAGTTWFEAQLFAGKPDWNYLRSLPPAKLSPAEKAFMDGPVDELCAMLDDWQIEFEHHDLPEHVWQFIKSQGFLGMIIPEQYGGKGFSNFAHSEVVKRISTRNVSAAVTVMVPNSLGPGELLLKYGTEEQKNQYLPKLARGEEVPCFALTGVESGSDAADMHDTGIVCYGDWNGERVLGMRLNWEKRYITLAPVSTLMGLAFKLYDPDKLLGGETDLGITVALIPTHLPGVDIGRRHFPAYLAFQNGPTHGHDVFVPLTQILGGQAQIGTGWKMLMGALAAGRSISLPSLSTAGLQLAARTTGAYGRIRKQFNLPVGDFELVREVIARIAGMTYLVDSARRLTMVALDKGEHPAVISAILKYHATERMRRAINDAMDVHGGKGIQDGPKNYLGTVYRSIPIGITVEGANILTRGLIIFGQGAIRCHPYLMREMAALALPDKEKALEEFDKALFGHLGYQISNAARSFVHNLTNGFFAGVPEAGKATRYYRQLARVSASLAVAAEIALVGLGGSLKRRESISARLGDILAELYLLTGAVKRFEDDGQPAADQPLLDWALAESLYTIETRLDEVIRNFPAPFWGLLMRALTLPLGRRRRPPSDKLSHDAGQTIMVDGETRERLTSGVFIGTGTALSALDAAFRAVLATNDLERRLSKERVRDIDQALGRGLINTDEARRLRDARALVRKVVEVDDFDKSEITGLGDAGPPSYANESEFRRAASSS